MTTETEENGGGPVEVCSPMDIRNARPLKIPHPVNLAHPVQCRRCTGEYSVQESGPDNGKMFSCGIMVENIEAGVSSFSCPYQVLKPIAPIINAEQANKSPHEFIDAAMAYKILPKTLTKCSACPAVSICDAHITGGTWPHAKGISPCKVVL
jgi:hypothetical protein